MIAGTRTHGRRTLVSMLALTVRNLLMPAAALILLVVAGGLALFGTQALPAIVLALGAILAGLALLVALALRRHV